MHTLYCSLLGETKRGDFTRALVDAMAAGRGHKQVYLLPSDYLLNETRRQIKNMGPDGYELPRLLSFDELAEEIARSAGCRYRLMDRMTQEMLVGDIVAELSAAGKLPYFSSIAAFPGFISTITSLLAEIKGTGTPPAEFAAMAGARGELVKDREVYAIYLSYQACLEELELADLEETYFLAIRALQNKTAPVDYDKIYISEFYLFSPLQLELIRQLSLLAPIDIGLIYEKNRQRLFAAVEPTYSALVGIGFRSEFVAAGRRLTAALEHIKANLYAVDGLRLADAGGLEVVTCPDRGREMALVAAKVKQVLLSGVCRPRDIAVVARDLKAYADFRQVCADYGVPVSLAWDGALSDQPLAVLLDCLLTARLDNGSRHNVLNMLKSPLLAGIVPDADLLERESADVFIRSWRDWRAFWGSDAGKYNGFIAFCNIVAALPERGTCRELTDAVKRLVAGLGIPDKLGADYKSGLLSLPLFKAGLLTFDRLTGPEGILEGLVQGFAMLDNSGRKLSLGEFLQFFRKAMAGERIRFEAAARDGVQFVSPLAVRGVSFSAVFVLGLAEGEFPFRGRENWLYDDRERSMLNDLGLAVRTAGSRRQEEDLYFAIAVSLADRTLTLCCREDAETMPSPYVDEIVRLFAPGAVKLEEHTASEFFPQDYTAIYSAGDLAGRVLTDAGDCRQGPADIAAYVADNITDADFARRVEAEAERKSTQSGAYNGLVEMRLPPQPAFSITALEDYAKCPFYYYAKRVLKLDEWEEKDEEAGLDIVGNFYHEVLANFFRAHAGQVLRTERRDEYQNELREIVGRSFEQLAAEKTIVEGKLWGYQRRRLETALSLWLDGEIAEQNRAGLQFKPLFFEWGFGLPVVEGMDAASVAAPLTIEAGGQIIYVSGKVDRIDAAGDKLAVIDYKRKACPNYRQLAQGLDLQAALYIMAVEQHLCRDGLVAGGGYYSVEGRKKEGGMWRAELTGDIGHRSAKREGNLTTEQWQEVQQAVRNRVAGYAAGIKAGWFPAAPAADCPAWCIGRRLCRYRPEDGLTAKQAGGDGNG